MYQIDLQYVRTARAELSAQKTALCGIVEELSRIEHILMNMNFTEEICVCLNEIRREIDEECAAFHQMALCLEKTEAAYRMTERKIADRYDLEYISYPKTKFGVSKITGLEGYESLLVFGNGRRRT